MRRSSLRIPGRGGGRQAAPFKDFRPPSPSGGRALCAPSYQRRWVFQQRSTRRRHSRQRLPLGSSYQRKKVCQGAKCRYEHRQCLSTVCLSLGASVQCGTVCRLRRFAWGRPGTSSRVAGRACHTTSGTVPPRYGSAVLSPACYSSRPCVFSVLCAVLAALRSVVVSKATKPSGQAGHSRPHPLPAVGADSDGIPLRCTRHRLRRGHGARPDGREPSTFDPGMGRSVPGPGGSLPTHNVGLFRCSREPCVSLPRRSRARRPSRCQTPSGATLHFVPRPWLLGDSKPGSRPDRIKKGNEITRIADPP